MSFWGRNKWLSEGKSEKPPVEKWDTKRVEAAGYRLSVGQEVYTNGQSGEVVQSLEEGQGFVISPGQFAFILTEEIVNIPQNSIGFISIRASIKFLGLVNVSGFQVNPGFNGNLIFAVFNAGPKHIHLKRGDDIFSLWIADLDDADVSDFIDKGKIPNNLSEIPSSVVNGIAGESLTAYQLSESLAALTKKVEVIETLSSRQKFYLRIIFGFVITIGLAMMRPVFSKYFVPEAPDTQEIQQSSPTAEEANSTRPNDSVYSPNTEEN